MCHLPLLTLCSQNPHEMWEFSVQCLYVHTAHSYEPHKHSYGWKRKKITQNYAIKCGFDSNTHYPVLYTDSTLSTFIYLTCGDGEIKCESNQMARERFQLPCNFSYWTFDGVKFSSLVHFSWYIFFSLQFIFSPCKFFFRQIFSSAIFFIRQILLHVKSVLVNFLCGISLRLWVWFLENSSVWRLLKHLHLYV